MVDTCIRSSVGRKKTEVKGMDSCDRGGRERGKLNCCSQATTTNASRPVAGEKRREGKPVFALDRMKVGVVELCQSRDV